MRYPRNVNPMPHAEWFLTPDWFNAALFIVVALAFLIGGSGCAAVTCVTQGTYACGLN
jgi:hypothetical protein